MLCRPSFFTIISLFGRFQFNNGNILANISLLSIFNGLCGLVAVFIACELGQRMTDAFDEINDTLDQSNWYLLPIEFQRILPMIMVNAQQPVFLECFGSIGCTRDVFKNVRIKYQMSNRKQPCSMDILIII